MANRIQQTWDEIRRWKKFFDNMISNGSARPDYLSSRSYKKELLDRYRELLSHRYKDLTQDERALRRFINRERRQLEKEIYPNGVVRFTGNLFRLAANMVKLPFQVITGPRRAERDAQSVSNALGRQGFGKQSQAVASRLKQGESRVGYQVSESPSPREV